MSPPQRINKGHKNKQQNRSVQALPPQQMVPSLLPPTPNLSPQQMVPSLLSPTPNLPPQQMVPSLLPPTPNSVPTTPMPLYPTGAAAIIPAPPTYELFPNRIFVGGFPLSTTESDLRDHFERFFPVKDVKIVKSLDGQSKGYGFITFETEDQAEEIRQFDPKQLEFRNRKLNLGPAIRKMNYGAIPPGYAFAAPNQFYPAPPGPFGYAVPASPGAGGGFSYPPASPGAGGGFSFPPASPMFIYPSY
ncbi:unnamed protein product [Caenorhabditis brenneri]